MLIKILLIKIIDHIIIHDEKKPLLESYSSILTKIFNSTNYNPYLVRFYLKIKKHGNYTNIDRYINYHLCYIERVFGKIITKLKNDLFVKKESQYFLYFQAFLDIYLKNQIKVSDKDEIFEKIGFFHLFHFGLMFHNEQSIYPIHNHVIKILY